MDESWRRIAGMHVSKNGDIALAWVALDPVADQVHLYDCCTFKREVLVVIAEGINCRGRWVPVAYEKSGEAVAEELLDKGCRMLPEPIVETEAMAEVFSRDIWERMRTNRFKVNKRLGDWLDEYKRFFREDGDVPTEGFPLMSATRHAISQLNFARRRKKAGATHKNYPQVAIL